MRFTSPLVARTLSASRTGLRLTLNSRQSASSVNLYSGGYCQEITRSLSVATIDPLSVGLVDAMAFNSLVVVAAPAISTRRCTVGLQRTIGAIAALARQQASATKRRDTRPRSY